MLYYALVFLVLGLIAGVFRLLRGGSDRDTDCLASVLGRFVLLVIHLVTGRTPRTPITWECHDSAEKLEHRSSFFYFHARTLRTRRAHRARDLACEHHPCLWGSRLDQRPGVDCLDLGVVGKELLPFRIVRQLHVGRSADE